MEGDQIASAGLRGFQPGSQLGNYRLKRLIGKGGFGHVWEAEDTVMDRAVALKLLRSDYSDNDKFRQRLFREARAAGRLHEPHVVPIHHCGEVDGQLYIDMRLIVGTDLETVLSQKGPMTPARAVAVVHQVATALDAAHAAGLIHRDVKPANILLTDDDFACLLDFGLANAASDAKLTSTGFTFGTFAYMAPERFSAGGEVDRRVDVYAVACLLYELLTGRPPYSGDMPALMSAHLTAPIPRASQQRPGIPAAMDDVIARGMAKKIGDRYDSAGELARVAKRALSSRDEAQAETIAASFAPTQKAVTPQPPNPLVHDADAPLARGRHVFHQLSRANKVGVFVGLAFVVLAVAVLAVRAFGTDNNSSNGASSASPAAATSSAVGSSPAARSTTTAPPTIASPTPAASLNTSTTPVASPPTPGSETGSQADINTLANNLSNGYSLNNCTAMPIGGGELAALTCGKSPVAKGPVQAKFMLFSSAADLTRWFNSSIKDDVLVNCGDSATNGPAPWHQGPNATTNGGVMACGTYQKAAEIIWTTDAKNVLSYIRASNADMPPLYEWWQANG